jgi:Flp pilus assembly protein TadG
MKSGGRSRNGPGNRQRGQSAVEFALVMPLFLILIFSIVDFGMGLRAWIAITNSAREGARAGAVGVDCANIKQRAVDTADGLVTTSDVSVTGGVDCGGNPGNPVVVTVNYDYQYITPLGNFVQGITGPLHLHATSNMRLE